MMANSEAQTIVICELCDNSNTVRWSCVNCLENLCDSCKIVHERGKLTKHHEVVSKRDYYRLQGTKRLESQCEFHNDICTLHCVGCNEILCTTCVTENHSGHALQKIEIVHQERHKTISDNVKEIQNLQLSDLSDRRRSITNIREEHKKDKHSLRENVLTQTANIESTIASCSKSLLDKIDKFYDGDEMRLSQTCDAIEELHLALGKQYEDAENLLNSNDTRRFIGVENSNIMKAVQSVTQYNTPCNIKRPSFRGKTKIDFPQIDALFGTLQFPSFDFPDQQSGSIQLKFIFEFDKIDKYEIISPLDLSNVWVRDKQTREVCMWRRDTDNQDIEHQESGRELITIDKGNNSIQAISQNGAVREIRHYLFWQPTCIHVAGDIITVGLVDNRMDFEAETVRFGQSLKSPLRLWDFLRAHANEYRSKNYRYPPLYKKYALILSSFHRAKCVLMTLNGEILDTVYCENNDVLKGPLQNMTFCVLNNASVITHEVRDKGQYIVKREKTGEVTMTCDLSNIQPRGDGIVCTSLGIILILDTDNKIHFINDTGTVVSNIVLKDLSIIYADRLFVDKHDRVWIKGKHEDQARDGSVFITGF